MLKIYTLSHHRADLLELQIASFKKYLREDFEFTVFNNALIDPRLGHESVNIYTAADRWNAKTVNIERDVEVFKECQALESGFIFDQNGVYANANVACAYPLCWAWRQVIHKQNDNILFLHSDVFLVEPIKLTDLLKDNVFAYIAQGRPNNVRYMWDAFFLADLRRLPDAKSLNWFCGTVNGEQVDVGGQTHHYLAAHSDLPRLEIRNDYISVDPETLFQPSDYEFFYAGEKKIALHYRSASNWNRRSREYHEQKTTWLRGVLGLDISLKV